MRDLETDHVISEPKEASRYMSWEGDKHTNTHTNTNKDIPSTRLTRPRWPVSERGGQIYTYIGDDSLHFSASAETTI